MTGLLKQSRSTRNSWHSPTPHIEEVDGISEGVDPKAFGQTAEQYRVDVISGPVGEALLG